MTYNGVTELSNTMPSRLFKSTPSLKFTTKLTRNQVHHKAELLKAQELINRLGEGETVGEDVGEDGDKKAKKKEDNGLNDIKVRPDTPSVSYTHLTLPTIYSV